jgi:hypothetical protein
VHTEWSAVSSAAGNKSITAEENFAKHTQTISDLLVFNDLLIDAYGLSLDPDGPTYQLIKITPSSLKRVGCDFFYLI